MIFKIPKSLKLGGSTIRVLVVDQCTNNESEVDGLARYAPQTIELKRDKTFSTDYVEFVFFHELFHHIFDKMDEKELRGNEKIVSQLATFMHQAIKSMK